MSVLLQTQRKEEAKFYTYEVFHAVLALLERDDCHQYVINLLAL